MRLYTFVAGLYLSELQKGLQTAHVVSDLFVSVPLECPAREALWSWAEEHKTIIICQAHTSGNVSRVYDRLLEFAYSFDLPTACFCEDEESLGGATTACGIIVPPEFYEAVIVGGKPNFPRDQNDIFRYASYIDPQGGEHQYGSNSDEFLFIEFLKSFQLA